MSEPSLDEMISRHIDQRLDLVLDRVVDTLVERIASPFDPWFSSVQAAAYLGYEGDDGGRWVSELAKAGKIEGDQDERGRWRFRRSKLDAFAEGRPSGGS